MMGMTRAFGRRRRNWAVAPLCLSLCLLGLSLRQLGPAPHWAGHGLFGLSAWHSVRRASKASGATTMFGCTAAVAIQSAPALPASTSCFSSSYFTGSRLTGLMLAVLRPASPTSVKLSRLDLPSGQITSSQSLPISTSPLERISSTLGALSFQQCRVGFPITKQGGCRPRTAQTPE